MALGSSSSSSSDEIVIKAPTDRRLYRLLHLPSGLTALLVHDPEIFPDTPLQDSEPFENGKEEEEGDDDEEEEEEEDEDEEDEEMEDEDDDEEEEDEEVTDKKTGGVMPTKKVGDSSHSF